jgi:hypothetical protein
MGVFTDSPLDASIFADEPSRPPSPISHVRLKVENDRELKKSNSELPSKWRRRWTPPGAERWRRTGKLHQYNDIVRRSPKMIAVLNY